MGFNRRAFLKGSGSMLSLLAAGGFLKPSISFAQSQGGNDRNMIVLFLRGGADGQFLFPYGTGIASTFQSLRGSIFVPSSDILLSGDLLAAQNGLPSQIGLQEEWNDLYNECGDNIHLFKSIGTTTYLGGSHEVKTNIYHAGAHDVQAANAKGWFARFVEGASLDLYQSWGLGNFGPDARFNAEGEGVEKPLLLGSLGSFNYQWRNFGSLGNTSAYDDSWQARQVAINHFGKGAAASEVVQKVHDTLSQTHEAVDVIDAISDLSTVGDYTTSDANSGVTSFKSRCRDLAKILKYKESQSNLRSRPLVAHLERSGWDTHSGQISSLVGDNTFNRGLIADISRGLRGLVEDLKATPAQGYANAWEKTVVVIYSEFGRTSRVNGGNGTDHSWATNGMMLGGSVRPGVSGAAPSVADLLDNNRVTAALDFRAPIEAAVNWLGLNPATVFPEEHTPQWQGLNLFT